MYSKWGLMAWKPSVLNPVCRNGWGHSHLSYYNKQHIFLIINSQSDIGEGMANIVMKYVCRYVTIVTTACMQLPCSHTGDQEGSKTWLATLSRPVSSKYSCKQARGWVQDKVPVLRANFITITCFNSSHKIYTLPHTLPEVPTNSSESPPFKRTSLICKRKKAIHYTLSVHNSQQSVPDSVMLTGEALWKLKLILP